MANSWPKNILDPIHGLIQFRNEASDRLFLDLIDTRELQRLRRIKQLGMSDQVFPGASHSRFSHSIGVMHTARRFLDQIARIQGRSTHEDSHAIVLTAALLHDIGHGPFSHAFEKATGMDHEKWMTEIIKDDSTEVHQVLSAYNKDLPGRVVSFYADDTYLTQIIRSQIDSDRSDYLLRDSHATGTEYGNFDLRWLIDNLYLDDEERFYFGRKALEAVESYLFARYHMYRAVYFRKATRAAEVMLRLILQRYKELLRQRESREDRQSVVLDAPCAIVRAFSGSMNLHDYLALDDHTITEFLKACEGASDQILRDLGTGLIHRHLYKCLDATDADLNGDQRFSCAVREFLCEKRLDPEYYLVFDTASDTPYKPYDPGDDHPATQIYIEKSTGKRVEISEYSAPIEQLRKKSQLRRYYFPESLRDNIRSIANETNGNGVIGRNTNEV